MADADSRVSSEDVTVTKSLDRERFKTPAVVLEIRSDRETPTSIAVTDRIPEEIAIDDVGFHPDYGGEHWSIEGNEVTFEYTVDPGETYTTVYGVRNVDDQALRTVLDSPPSLRVTPEAAEADDGIEDLLSDDEDVVRDVISGERDSLQVSDDEPPEPAAEEEGPPAEASPGDATTEAGQADAPDEAEPPAEPAAGTNAPEETEPPAEPAAGAAEADAPEETEPAGDAAVEPAEPAEPFEVSDEEAGGDEPELIGEETPGEDAAATEGEPAADDAAPVEEAPDVGGDASIAPGSVASALVAELEEGRVDEDDKRALREALSIEEDADEPEVPGSVDARIEHLQNEVSDLAAYADALETFLDEHGGGDSVLVDIERDLDYTMDSIEELEERIEALDAGTEDLELELSAVAGAVEDVETRIEDLETDVNDLLYLEEEVMEMEGIGDDLDALEADVDDLREEHERIDDLESRAASLEDAIDDLRAEMEEMKSFRDRLSSAFGPGEE